MDIHEVLKDHEMHGKDAPAGILEKAFDRYKEAYPNSEISIDDFSKSFRKSTGFLIDEKGNCITLCKLVSNYIEALSHHASYLFLFSKNHESFLANIYAIMLPRLSVIYPISAMPLHNQNYFNLYC